MGAQPQAGEGALGCRGVQHRSSIGLWSKGLRIGPDPGRLLRPSRGALGEEVKVVSPDPRRSGPSAPGKGRRRPLWSPRSGGAPAKDRGHSRSRGPRPDPRNPRRQRDEDTIFAPEAGGGDYLAPPGEDLGPGPGRSRAAKLPGAVGSIEISAWRRARADPPYYNKCPVCRAGLHIRRESI